MSTCRMRPWARLLVLIGVVGAGPALAQNVARDVTLTCAADGSGCPVRIPDNSGAGIGTISVLADACFGFPATAVAVSAVVRHANVGDLRVILRNPLSNTFPLLDRAREIAGAPLGSCAGDDLDVTFKDGASTTIQCRELIPAINDVRAPQTGLGSLVGQVQSGTWELEVQDRASGGDGELLAWSLTFTCNLPIEIFADGFE